MLAVSGIKSHVIELETTAFYQQKIYMFVYRSFLNITFFNNYVFLMFLGICWSVWRSAVLISSAGDVGGISGVRIISWTFIWLHMFPLRSSRAKESCHLQKRISLGGKMRQIKRLHITNTSSLQFLEKMSKAMTKHGGIPHTSKTFHTFRVNNLNSTVNIQTA